MQNNVISIQWKRKQRQIQSEPPPKKLTSQDQRQMNNLAGEVEDLRRELEEVRSLLRRTLLLLRKTDKSHNAASEIDD